MWQLGASGDRPEWRTAETPFDETLFGVAQTVEGPYAVGDDGTLVADRGRGWEVVFDDGPATRENQLRSMDVTDDGERVWLLGSSGAMACYDVEERKKFDYSYPKEMTSTWEGITVSGERGSEKALAANGSGEVLPFAIDGFDVDWGQLDKPGDRGSTIAALASTPGGVGFAVDTSGNAFKTTPDEGWNDVGVVNAQVKFYDVYAGANQRVYIAAGDGRVYRYDDSYHDWTPVGVTRTQSVLVGRREPQALVNVAESASLRAIDVYQQENGRKQMVAMGSQGTIYRREGAERWEQLPSPTSATLYDLRLGDPDVAVGANGTIIERPRGEPRDAGTSPDGDEFDGRGENYDGDDSEPGEASNDAEASGGTDNVEASEDPDDDADSRSDDPDTDPDDGHDSGANDPDEDADDEPDDGTSDPDTDPDDEPDDGTDDADTDPDDDADDETSDSNDADDEDDRDDGVIGGTEATSSVGVGGWNQAETGTSAESRTRTEAGTESGTETGAESGSDAGTETGTESSTGTETDTETGTETDPKTREDVLVTLAKQTSLDGEELDTAIESGSELIEDVLVEIAEEVGVDPERVRDALHQPAE